MLRGTKVSRGRVLAFGGLRDRLAFLTSRRSQTSLSEARETTPDGRDGLLALGRQLGLCGEEWPPLSLSPAGPNGCHEREFGDEQL